MAVRYTIPFKADDNESWRIDISDNSLTSTPVTLRGARGTHSLQYNGDTDDPYTVLFPSNLSFSVINQGNIDVGEFQNSQDKDFTVSLYRSGNLFWIGYLKVEGIQRPFKSNPTVVRFEALDGLSMLADIDYTHADLNGGRCPINYFRQILFATSNLGLPLPIRWTNLLQNSAFLGEDVFSGSVSWSADNQGFYSYQAQQSGGETGQIKKCGEILEEMLRSMQCRISQVGGKWVIRRINDVISGAFPYKQVSASLGDLIVTSGNESITKLLGRSGYQFIAEDAIITTKQGLKSVKVEYDANVRENILPNGSQDITTVIEGSEKPIYWGYYEPDTNNYYESFPSIDGRSGKSVFVYSDSDIENIYYTLKIDGGEYGENGLPVDSTTLVKRISLGFLISITGGVFVEPDSDVIVWDNEPVKIQVIFNLGAAKYYLNEFGFWQITPIEIPIIIQGLKLNEVARVDFDKFQGIILPTNNIQPTPDDVSDLTISFRLRNGIPFSNNATYYLDNIYFSIETSNDVYESTYVQSKNTTTDSRTLKISSSYGGYMVSNFMTAWYNSDKECFFRDGIYYQGILEQLLYEGTLTGLTANAMMRNRYKASKIFNGTINVRKGNWNFDQIYLIDTFGTEKYLPLNADYNIELCTVNLVAMECRNDAIELTEKYYSSNDKQLSN